MQRGRWAGQEMSTAADSVGGRGVRSLYGPKGWSLRLPRLASAVLCPTAGNFDAHTGLPARCWQLLPRWLRGVRRRHHIRSRGRQHTGCGSSPCHTALCLCAPEEAIMGPGVGGRVQAVLRLVC